MTLSHYTAVFVAAPAQAGLEKRFLDALRNAGHHAKTVRELSRKGDDIALDVDVGVRDEDAAIDLQKTLVTACKGRADIAVLPTEARRKRLLICDMDSTIIGQECLDELADFAGRKAEVSAITERAMAGELDFEGALTARVAMLEGLEMTALQACYDERISLNTGARTLVKTMIANGARAVLVSGGFTFFTSRVAADAGFQDHRGNTLRDDGTRLTGDVGRPILGRAAKLEALDAECAALGMDRGNALAMGDGANDLAMITAAGLGIAFEAKPIVAAQARAAINATSLRTALYFQGYSAADFVS